MTKNIRDNYKNYTNKLKDLTENKEDYTYTSFSTNLENPIDNYLHENGTETSLVTFDLDKIISKYGDNPGILQLILSSKVEEDRRRAEEAKLKQRELEYLLSHKADHKCRNSGCSEDMTPNHSKNFEKGKERENMSSNKADCNQLPVTKTLLQEDNYNSSVKRKSRDEHDELRSLCPSSQPLHNKNDDYFSSSLSSSYLSPPAYDGSETRLRRQGSFQQQFSPTLIASKSRRRTSSIPTEEPTLRLQSLDYITSRPNFSDPLSQLPYRRSSSTGKYNVNDAIPPNTLPPISASLLSSDQLRIGVHDISSITHKNHSPSITSVPLKSNRTRFQNLPTLDSFETSIMETLPFDNTSENSSMIEDENDSNSELVTTNVHFSDSKPILDKSSEVKDNTPSNLLNSDITNTKKLPLPPNPLGNVQNLSHPSNRPRRRRREMQPITMIIETRDFPYNDDYVWKNNGNTIHKSSGQKSIYYKCSNSNAGCPVNKTVTFRDNGEYLIKYRGSHLDECSKIRRVNLPA